MIHLAETDSTSNYLAKLCEQSVVEEFTVVQAGYQTSGKGQRGNSWEAERDKNLLFSVVLYPHFIEIRNQFLVSQIISLAVKEALDEYTEDFSIKWPNDIYWKNRKICGMLIENQLLGSTLQQSIAGIGINVNQQEFHSHAPNPVSLRQITGREYSISAVLEAVMKNVKHYYRLLQQGETEAIQQRYFQALFRKEGYHPYQDENGMFTARIAQIEPTGILILKDKSEKERRYAFKEVRFL